MILFNKELLELQVESFCNKNKEKINDSDAYIVNKIISNYNANVSGLFKDQKEKELLEFKSVIKEKKKELQKETKDFYKLTDMHDIICFVSIDRPDLVKEILVRKYHQDLEEGFFNEDKDFLIKNEIINKNELDVIESGYEYIQKEEDLYFIFF